MIKDLHRESAGRYSGEQLPASITSNMVRKVVIRARGRKAGPAVAWRLDAPLKEEHRFASKDD